MGTEAGVRDRLCGTLWKWSLQRIGEDGVQSGAGATQDRKGLELVGIPECLGLNAVWELNNESSIRHLAIPSRRAGLPPRTLNAPL